MIEPLSRTAERSGFQQPASLLRPV